MTGGLLFACLALVLHLLWSVTLEFDLNAQIFADLFFHDRWHQLSCEWIAPGRKEFVVLIGLLAVFMAAQNLIGVVMAKLMGLNAAVGLLLGTVSLVGGHGVTIAWSPSFVDAFELANAMEIGLRHDFNHRLDSCQPFGWSGCERICIDQHGAVFAFTVGAIVDWAPLTALFKLMHLIVVDFLPKPFVQLHSRSMSASLPGS